MALHTRPTFWSVNPVQRLSVAIRAIAARICMYNIGPLWSRLTSSLISCLSLLSAGSWSVTYDLHHFVSTMHPKVVLFYMSLDSSRYSVPINMYTLISDIYDYVSMAQPQVVSIFQVLFLFNHIIYA